MKILEAYSNLLTEAHVEGCVKKFGLELFGDELSGKEKNTQIEKSYVNTIEDFTDSQYGGKTSQAFVQALNTLKGCMREYPEVLIPEKTDVYRGLTIPIKYFADHHEKIDIQKPFPYVYKATSQIQSWGTDFDSASLFGNHDMLNDIAKSLNLADYQTPQARKQLLSNLITQNIRIAFVLQYKTNPKEFIFKSEYFRLISKVYHESEMIRLDNKPINVIAKFNDHVDVFLTYKAIQLIRIINQAILES